MLHVYAIVAITMGNNVELLQYTLIRTKGDMPHTFVFPSPDRPQASRWAEMIQRPEIEQIEFVRNEIGTLFDSLDPRHKEAYRRKVSCDIRPEMIDESAFIDPIKNYLRTAFSPEFTAGHRDLDGAYFELACSVTNTHRQQSDVDMRLGMRTRHIDQIYAGPCLGSFTSADFRGYPWRTPRGILRSYAELPMHMYGWKASELEVVQSPATEAQFVLDGYMRHYPKLLVPSQLIRFAQAVFTTANKSELRWDIEERPLF